MLAKGFVAVHVRSRVRRMEGYECYWYVMFRLKACHRLVTAGIF